MLQLGLIGWPLEHSFSPSYFGKKFKEAGIEGSYELFPLENIGALPEMLASNPRLKGFNVTAPYKESVMKYLDEIEESALAIGAVNTVKIKSGKLKGYNTDRIGFMTSLMPLIKDRLEVRNALVTGTGGAAKAVAHALWMLGLDTTFVSRRPEQSSLHPSIRYEALTPDIMQDHLLVINATPLGMSPHTDTFPDIPYEFLTNRHICYDLIYNPVETEFLTRCRLMGAKTKNGLDMLHGQAEAAWDIWTSQI